MQAVDQNGGEGCIVAAGGLTGERAAGVQGGLEFAADFVGLEFVVGHEVLIMGEEFGLENVKPVEFAEEVCGGVGNGTHGVGGIETLILLERAVRFGELHVVHLASPGRQRYGCVGNSGDDPESGGEDQVFEYHSTSCLRRGGRIPARRSENAGV